MNIIQMGGALVTVMALAGYTPLPLWACFLIGVPLFFAVFMGSIYLLFARKEKSWK